MSEPTSPSLLCRVRNSSDATSWREFAGLYETLIRRWLYTHRVQTTDADDIVQEVLLFVHREIPRFEHNGRTGAFRNWLRQVTANRLREFCRRQKRASTEGPDLESLADQLADNDSPVSKLWQREHDRHVLEQLLAAIKDQFQQNSLIAFRSIVLEERPAQQVPMFLVLWVGLL